MRWLLDLVIALTRSWAATYTRGLPPDVRAERREEIDCDLWHQQRLADLERQPVTGTAMEILVRWLSGIPSDITWRAWTLRSLRAEHQSGIAAMNNSENRWKWILLVLVGSLAALGSMWAYASSLESWGDVRAVIFVAGGPLLLLIAALAFLALVADVVMRRRTDP